VVPPLHLSATYTFEDLGMPRRYDYSRTANPTRDGLADAISDLEGGAGATITSSGMAAINLLCQLLEPGDILLAPHDCYGGTHRLLSALERRNRFEVHFVDQTDPVALNEAFTASPRIILVETPSNPLLRITDLALVGELCKETGTLFAVDNTFLSPALQSPISFGADVVIHSTTKYLNGHSDIVGGAVVAAEGHIHEELQWWANCLGLSGAPFDSFLTLRGIRTLHARIRSHEENAAAIADLLSNSPQVDVVHYPGLESHPGHEIAARQQSGFGAMISFELDGGIEAVRAFLNGLDHFFLAESLGGVESLVAHPTTMTHAAMDPIARDRAGISDGLIRLSVGIEDPSDLLEDVRSGLERAAAAQEQAMTIQSVH
jgi:cystathionine gamma-synthase